MIEAGIVNTEVSHNAMISQDLLEILRCPLDPSNTRLRQQDQFLVCERCSLQFHIKDGFPVLLVEDAELPAGCTSLKDLPCQKPQKG